MATTVINRQVQPKLTSRNTNGEEFENDINENIDLNTHIKDAEDLDNTTHYFTSLVQQAAWQATTRNEQHATSLANTALYIRQLISEKGELEEGDKDHATYITRLHYPDTSLLQLKRLKTPYTKHMSITCLPMTTVCGRSKKSSKDQHLQWHL